MSLLRRIPRRAWILVAVCAMSTGWAGCNDIKDFLGIGPETPAAAGNKPVLQNFGAQAPHKVDKRVGPSIMQHPPYAEEKCSACHPDPGDNAILSVDPNVCMKCHTNVLHEYPRMHGAVVGRACLWCHEPHESTSPHLLRTENQSLCFQCHERSQLSTTTAGHRLDKVVCLHCHMGHGGNEVPFLKPSILAPNIPVVRPTSRPSTQPAQ